MIFRDVTIGNGAVQSRRVVDSRELSANAVDLCKSLLSRLRAGEPEVEHGVEGLPPFSVRLGMPEEFKPAAGNALVFCVGAPGQTPFQFNCLVQKDTEQTPALYGITTILGVSLQGRGMAVTALSEIVAPLYEERPIVVATVLPIAGVDEEPIMVAADFATCFAAAWLLKGDF